MIQAKSTRSQWNTGLDGNLLKYIGIKSVDVPEQFVSSFFENFIERNSFVFELGNSSDNRSIACSKTPTTN
jgi:hypothetical protein